MQELCTQAIKNPELWIIVGFLVGMFCGYSVGKLARGPKEGLR